MKVRFYGQGVNANIAETIGNMLSQSFEELSYVYGIIIVQGTAA